MSEHRHSSSEVSRCVKAFRRLVRFLRSLSAAKFKKDILECWVVSLPLVIGTGSMTSALLVSVRARL
jgi:hypothetical protein